MHKFTLIISNSESPLEQSILPETISHDIMVEDKHDPIEVFKKAEDFIRECRAGRDEVLLRLQIVDEKGNLRFEGNVKEGLQGIWRS